MTRLVLFAGLLALAACGVDGPPQHPEGTEPGIRIEGTAVFGITRG